MLRDEVPRVGHVAFVVACFIEAHADAEQYAQITYATVARGTGLGRYAVVRALLRLELEGWVRIDHPKQGSRVGLQVRLMPSGEDPDSAVRSDPLQF